MSNNCLVTKLKGTVDNPNLPVYGAFYIEHIVSSDTADDVNVFGNNGDQLTVKSDEITEVFDYNNVAHSLPWTMGIFAQASNYSQTLKVKQKGKLYFTSKYDVNGIFFPNHNFKFLGTLKDIALKNNQPSNNYFIKILDSQEVTGDISDLINEGSINHLTTLDLQGCLKVTGTASDLGKFVNATELSVLYTKITGNIEDIVASQIAGGVSSRNASNALYSNACLGQFEFGGVKHTGPKFGYGRITWESSSKIAVYSGGLSLAACTTVVCKGYTQAEAETAFPGKEIVRVDA